MTDTTTIDGAALIQRVKDEITEDIDAGVVPATVASFSELHDYSDANTYGGLCDDLDPNSQIEHAGPVHLAMQDAVDAWLRAGRPTEDPSATIRIRAKRTGQGGRGRWFTATRGEVAAAELHGAEDTFENRMRQVIACRMVVPSDAVRVLEVA